ncbi:hypothetical protein H1C71_041380, partial [Ictidomys tridecemlineatus]
GRAVGTAGKATADSHARVCHLQSSASQRLPREVTTPAPLRRQSQVPSDMFSSLRRWGACRFYEPIPGGLDTQVKPTGPGAEEEQVLAAPVGAGVEKGGLVGSWDRG